jgi:D-arabinose 1-dehydrogenase-like Zn-dependent alcohol dehydrogenase
VTDSQYALYSADYLIPIPAALDSAGSAPLLCAGATVYAGLKAANIQPGQVSLTRRWLSLAGVARRDA